jgi:hypothetical protein
MKATKHLVSVAFRLEESKRRQLRVALARQGLSMQKALEGSVDEVIARSQYQGDDARRPEDLMGLLADTKVMEMREMERREELGRDRTRL